MVHRDLMTLKFRYIFFLYVLSQFVFYVQLCLRDKHINHYIFNNSVHITKKYTYQILKIIKFTCCYFQYLVCPIEVSVFSTTGQ